MLQYPWNKTDLIMTSHFSAFKSWLLLRVADQVSSLFFDELLLPPSIQVTTCWNIPRTSQSTAAFPTSSAWRPSSPVSFTLLTCHKPQVHECAPAGPKRRQPYAGLLNLGLSRHTSVTPWQPPFFCRRLRLSDAVIHHKSFYLPLFLLLSHDWKHEDIRSTHTHTHVVQ